MKQRPLIGIVGWSTGENSFGVTKPYLDHLSNFGDILILNPMRGIIENLDLVVLPGGSDTPSFLYGQPPSYKNSPSDQYKEWFVFNNLKQYIEAGVPIYGTCLGFQNLIVYFGGELCQDLKGHEYSEEFRGQKVHDLIFTSEYALLEASLVKKRKNKSIMTCSLHHQGAIRSEGHVPDVLNIVAYTKDDVVECIEHRELPIAGMQCHVEEDYNPLGNYLIHKLIKRSPNLNLQDENTGSNNTVQEQSSQ